MAEKLTLASMCAGGVQERIDRALAKISDNILDLNTDATLFLLLWELLAQMQSCRHILTSKFLKAM